MNKSIQLNNDKPNEPNGIDELLVNGIISDKLNEYNETLLKLITNNQKFVEDNYLLKNDYKEGSSKSTEMSSAE